MPIKKLKSLPNPLAGDWGANSPFFGYIEGYYGRMLSWDERRSIIDKLAGENLNTYLYAPKEDPFHRQEWRKPYPSKWQAAFKLFVKHAKEKNIAVIPGISPGLSFDYCSGADYSRLLKKLASFVKTGCKSVCLLMDDILAEFPASCKNRFSSLGNAHGKLLTRLQTDLHKIGGPDISLWFCPTIYAEELVGKNNESRRYLPDLAASMPPSTIVLWTGERVISKNISARSLRHVNKLFGGNVCVWDNVYANDYCPSKLFIGPYKNRDFDLMTAARGVLLNPTGLLHTDMFLLSLLAAFKEHRPCISSWQKFMAQLPFGKDMASVSRFFDLPFSKLHPSSLSAPRIKQSKASLKKLIWEWKSPLQREWYHYLYMLDCDLTLREKKFLKDDAAWIDKKYPPVLAEILKDR
jgi:hyaluronoglucosaminidase